MASSSTAAFRPRRLLITGASSGIGLAVETSAAGADLVQVAALWQLSEALIAEAAASCTVVA